MEARELRIHRLAGILGVFGMFLGVLAALAPPPFRLALVVTVFNGSLMIVYMISTIVLWNRLRVDRTTMDGGAA